MKTKKFKAYSEKQIRIVEGSCVVNFPYIVKQTKDVILISFDMKTKRGDISTYWSSDGEWAINLYANEESVHKHESFKNGTDIYFDGLNADDWIVFSCEYSRYTVNVTLYKK